jgi:ParB-like chromosome segregation protein Spo0J
VSAGASVVREKNAALTVEWRPLDALTPYPQNARVLSSKAVAKVAASIKAFGWRQPIVVDAAGVIIAGHTRLLAAQSLGLKAVPVLVADDLTPAQVRAYRLADNRTAREAARQLTGDEPSEDSAAVLLLGDIRDVIVTRWQKFTGRKAVCRGDS